MDKSGRRPLLMVSIVVLVSFYLVKTKSLLRFIMSNVFGFEGVCKWNFSWMLSHWNFFLS